jgi:hypothetical protein
MLDNRRDAAGEKSVRDRSAHCGDPLRPRRESPAADGGVRSRFGDVKHRGAIDRDPDFGQIESDKASDKVRCRLGSRRLKPSLDCGRCGVSAPLRRRHALNPTALLIDQNGRVSPANAFPERARQGAQLIAIRDIALEEDQTPGVFATEKRPFVGIKNEASAAADERLRHLGLRALARETPRVASLTWR